MACAFVPSIRGHGDLEALVERQGINGFYQSRAARTACCTVRKVEPLERALAGARALDCGPARRAVRASPGHGTCHRRSRARIDQAQSAVRLDARTAAGLRVRQRPPDQPASRAGLRVHRLRATARVRSRPASRNAPDAGGGKRKARRSAGSIRVGRRRHRSNRLPDSSSPLSRLHRETRTSCTCSPAESVAAREAGSYDLRSIIRCGGLL